MKIKISARRSSFACAMLAASIATSASTFNQDKSINTIIDNLEAQCLYQADARFTVSMPQLDNDIVYLLQLTEMANPADPLQTNSYIIDWRLSTDQPSKSGFSAYFNGNHYRFNGQRLQEYHLADDSVAFCPEKIGSKNDGVHRSVQFYNLLPGAIASDLRKMQSDSTTALWLNQDTIVSGLHQIAIKAITSLQGTTAREALYLFDPATNLPVRINFENNPGSISEQSVAIEYSPATAIKPTRPIDESMLIEMYSEPFALLRESNFTIENLPGQQMPSFALPTIDRKRMTYRSGDRLKAPTAIVLLEAESGFTPQLIEAMRRAISRLPYNANIIWAFTDNVAERIEPLVGSEKIDETTLLSARSLVRDCGAASLPTILLVDSDGVVKNIIIGYNNELDLDVIQKMTFLK